MADGRRWFPGSHERPEPENSGSGEDLAALRRTNRMIDAIAADLPVATSDSDEYAVAMMLAAWREDVGRDPMPAKPTLAQARNALQGGGRARLLARVVGSAAAVTLLFGGFGAAVYQSHPGDALYGLRTALFGTPSSVRTDPVVLSAQTELAEVEKLISQGDWEGAQRRLAVANARVNEVSDAQQRAELANRAQQAEAKIEAKDPEATVPPERLTPPPVQLSTSPTPVESTPESAESSAETTETTEITETTETPTETSGSSATSATSSPEVTSTTTGSAAGASATPSVSESATPSPAITSTPGSAPVVTTSVLPEPSVTASTPPGLDSPGAPSDGGATPSPPVRHLPSVPTVMPNHGVE